MVDEKSWYMSKTIWGSLIAVAAALGSAMGITIDSSSQAALTNAIIQLVGSFGAILAIYGRLSATEIIS